MEMSNPRISVIVAAYNAEKYLSRCLNSIREQTMGDFEVIVVDDGSSDGTALLADGFAQKDARFRVIHQANGGVSAARKAGLKAAVGTYMLHVDSDDWIEKDMLRQMVECAYAQSADMVICDFTIHHANGFIENRVQKPKQLDPTSVMGEMFFDLYGSLCNKLIRISLLRENAIDFIPGMNISEDQILVLRLLMLPIRIAYVSGGFYHYDHTQNNLSLTQSGMKASERLRPLEFVEQQIDLSPIQDYFDKAIFHIAFEYLYEPKELCPDYRATFGKHFASLRRASGFPIRAKLFVYLRIVGIRLPLAQIKRNIKRIFSPHAR